MTYAAHVQQLAELFHVQLNVIPDMHLAASAMGWRGVRCPACNRANRVLHEGRAMRCGSCKQPLKARS